MHRQTDRHIRRLLDTLVFIELYIFLINHTLLINTYIHPVKLKQSQGLNRIYRQYNSQ